MVLVCSGQMQHFTTCYLQQCQWWWAASQCLIYFVSPKFAMGSAHEPCQRSQTPRGNEGAEGTPRKEEMMGWRVPCKTTYILLDTIWYFTWVSWVIFCDLWCFIMSCVDLCFLLWMWDFAAKVPLTAEQWIDHHQVAVSHWSFQSYRSG